MPLKNIPNHDARLPTKHQLTIVEYASLSSLTTYYKPLSVNHQLTIIKRAKLTIAKHCHHY